MNPLQTPLWCLDLPSLGGTLGPEPEDFVVDEIPLYAASGSGQHVYVRVKKRGRTTPDLVSALARAAGVKPREVGYAGLKDKNAVTTQWFSLLARGSVPPGEWQLGEEFEVLESTLHDNKLRTGHLAGNQFSIRVVDLAAPEPVRASAIAGRLVASGLPNYFGEQRFGRDGQNLASALDWLAHGGRGRQRFKDKLYASVVQSEVFNRYVKRRLELGVERLLPGEVVRLANSGSMFCVEDPVAEQPRLESRDLVLTGPLPGPKMRQASGLALELEQAVLDELGLSEKLLGALARHAPGTRRDVFAPVEGLDWTLGEDSSLRLVFRLPAGSYATQVVREFVAPRDTAAMSAEVLRSDSSRG